MFVSYLLSSQVVLAGVAAALGVDLEDLDFEDIGFFQGSEFSIEKEFDAGSVELSSVRGESDLCFDLSIPLVTISSCFQSTSCLHQAMRNLNENACGCQPYLARGSGGWVVPACGSCRTSSRRRT